MTDESAQLVFKLNNVEMSLGVHAEEGLTVDDPNLHP
jgi:hypothetical protein